MDTSLNAQLHMLISKTGQERNKRNLILGFTNGRGESSKDLTDAEARELISYLRTQQANAGRQGEDAANRMRRRIISMAHELGWHNLVAGKWVADMPAINKWCRQHSYLKKELNKYTIQELPKLVSQFERVYKSYLKKF